MVMPSDLEIAANVVTALAIGLAAFNHVLTWPVGIVGCVLFGLVFHGGQLYADATLQVFFLVTSVIGWWHWHRVDVAHQPPVTRTRPGALVWMVVAAIAVTAAYGSLLFHFTDAYAPFIDSAVLSFSVVAQLLLMQRRLETWWVWFVVDVVSAPLFYSRGLTLTAVLYALYAVNAVYGGWRWRQQWLCLKTA